MKKMLLICGYDTEDGGLIGANLAFPLPNSEMTTYEEYINYLLPQLSSQAVVNYIIEEDFLEDQWTVYDEFGDESEEGITTHYKFHWVGYRNYALEYEFISDEGEIFIHTKRLETIFTP